MNKQVAETKFRDFIKSLSRDAAQHVPYAWPEEKKKPTTLTEFVPAVKILDAFLRDSEECSVFRDHLSEIANKLDPQEVESDKWLAIQEG